MNKGFASIAAIALTVIGSAAATAGETRRLKGPEGLVVTYRASSDRFCLRTTTERQASRMGLPLHATECRSRANWAHDGITLALRSEPASQVASVD